MSRSTRPRACTPEQTEVARHTSHVTRHTPHVTRHTPHATRHTSPLTRHTSHVTRHASYMQPLYRSFECCRNHLIAIAAGSSLSNHRVDVPFLQRILKQKTVIFFEFVGQSPKQHTSQTQTARHTRQNVTLFTLQNALTISPLRPWPSNTPTRKEAGSCAAAGVRMTKESCGR